MGYISQEVARANRPRKRTDREPHIGEYAAKTNAIRDGPQARAETEHQAGNGPTRLTGCGS